MKYIIYHRYPSYQSKEEVDAILKLLDVYIHNNLANRINTEIIIEEANNLLTQEKLGMLVVRLKREKATPGNTTIICYSLPSLIHSSIINMLRQLEELQQLATISVYDGPIPKYYEVMVKLAKDYNMTVTIEKGKLLTYRIAKNGQSYGRPTIDVDIDKATKLRAEGLSYQEISDRMGQSLSLIYSKLPKEVKIKYRRLRYERVGRPKGVIKG
jgi:hypothetical protein